MKFFYLLFATSSYQLLLLYTKDNDLLQPYIQISITERKINISLKLLLLLWPLRRNIVCRWEGVDLVTPDWRVVSDRLPRNILSFFQLFHPFKPWLCFSYVLTYSRTITGGDQILGNTNLLNKNHKFNKIQVHDSKLHISIQYFKVQTLWQISCEVKVNMSYLNSLNSLK
jgi:hypothetical protein